MAKNPATTVRPFGIRDKLGYMFGDFGNDFTFILSSSFMLKFYTDVMGIDGKIVGLLMMLARFVDAFTDVAMGQIVDRAKPTAAGKFRPWIKRMCGPVAIASFLVFQSGFAGAAMWFKITWMSVTYILWGSIFYTSINIPYGSMASAVSADPKERAELSTWRTIGATLAGLAIGVGTPLVAYVTVDGQDVLSGSRMTIIAGVFGVCAIICYLLCYNLVRERVEVPANNQKLDLVKLGKSLITNRALLGIIAAAIGLLLTMLTMQSMNNFIFPNYFGNAKIMTVPAMGSTVIMLFVCAPFAVKLSTKFGKKELSIASCLFGAVIYLIAFVIHTTNVYIYIGVYMLAYMGLGFFNTVIWAMITDVIDDAEVRNGVREDGTIYAVYSFARKLGQAFSAGLSGLLLDIVGYTDKTAFEPAVTNGIYNISTLVPVIGFVITAAFLWLVYPLNKKRVEQNVATLASRNQK